MCLECLSILADFFDFLRACTHTLRYMLTVTHTYTYAHTELYIATFLHFNISIIQIYRVTHTYTLAPKIPKDLYFAAFDPCSWPSMLKHCEKVAQQTMTILAISEAPR